MSEIMRDRMRTFLMYAQDHKGMGHVTRTLTIAGHLLAAYPDAVAYITTESPVVGDFTLPERCDYVKLPTRLTPGGIGQTEAEEEIARERFRHVRSQILRAAALGLAPDLVLVDHEPLGRNGEFREGLWALKAQCPGTKFVCGLRDIMDGPARIRAMWEELGVYEALDGLYDGIAVYGLRNLYDVAEAYAIPPSVQSKIQYCGYIIRDPPVVDAGTTRRQYGLPPDGRLVVATVGGGSDGYPVLEAAREAVERIQKRRPDLCALLVTGPLMPAEQQAMLRAQATSSIRVVSRADNFQLMAVADAIVGMGGYNTVCEALAVTRPLVIVPRSTHKIEQQIRAETLAEHGLAHWVHPKDLNGERLEEELEWALGRSHADHERLVREMIPSFEGATRLTEYLAQFLPPDRSNRRTSTEVASMLGQPA